MANQTMLEIARRAVETAQNKGADQAAASASVSREVEIGWRDGKLEKITEATSRALSVQLYVENRYSLVSTSDLRPDAVDRFLADSVVMARALAKDLHRALPETSLYEGQATLDLQLDDPSYEGLTAAQRREMAAALEQAARDVKGAERIVSVTTGVSDSRVQSARVHSNGFEGERSGTSFWLFADVSANDSDGRKPEESAYAGARHRADLPELADVGRRAAEWALRRLGAKKGKSAVMPVVVDNRAAGRLLSHLLGPLSASSLQQKRSMFENKLGAQIGSVQLDLVDDPLVVKGFGSQLYDSEGIAAKRRQVFEAGVLRNYYVDNYYGRKLSMPPTTARTTNLAWKLGSKSQGELIAGLQDAMLVTGFLGGNSNGTTGDFSLGIQGFRIQDGVIGDPLSEMNLSGNHLEFWKRLAAVGNDPYPYSTLRTPTMVFEGVQVAGT